MRALSLSLVVAIGAVCACSKPQASPTDAPAPLASSSAPAPIVEPPAPLAMRPLAPTVFPLARETDAACAKDDVAACMKLAEWLVFGDRVARDWSGAAARFDRACARGNMQACARLGAFHLHGLGVEQNEAYALSLFTRACDAGEGEGCARLGNEILEGTYAPFDAARAYALFRRGAEAGNARAALYLVGSEPRSSPAARDIVDRYVALATVACDRGEAIWCARLARGYSRGPSYGPPSTMRYLGEDDAKSRMYSLRACEKGWLAACSGDDAIRDAAQPLIEAQCDRGDYLACARSARPATSKRFGLDKLCRAGVPEACRSWSNLADASDLPAFREACSGGDVDACSALVATIKRTTAASVDKLRADHELSCEQGLASSCFELATGRTVVDGGVRDAGMPSDRVIALLDRACKGRDGSYVLDACLALAEAYRRGNGVAADPARTAEILRRACYAPVRSWELVRACIELAIMYDTGEGVARDPAHATDVYAVACTGGSKQACADLADRFAGGIGTPKNVERAEAMRTGKKHVLTDGGRFEPLWLLE